MAAWRPKHVVLTYVIYGHPVIGIFMNVVLFDDNKQILYVNWSRDSVVGIATRYVLEGPGIESRWGEIFCTYPDRFRGPPSLLYNGYRVFRGGEGGRDVMLTTHPF
jgi:hypothetical protein